MTAWRPFFLLLTLFGSFAVVFPQDRQTTDTPVLAGEWISTRVEMSDPVVSQVVFGLQETCTTELTIEQDAGSIKIGQVRSCTYKDKSKPARSWRRTNLYHFDQNMELTDSPFGMVASKTQWKNEALVVSRYKIEKGAGREKISKNPIETIRLNLTDGGKTLIETITYFGVRPNGANGSETRTFFVKAK
jgi:hypothetical protein